MQAEEYLKRIKKIDALIINKTNEYSRWREIAEGISGGFSASDGVQSSKNLQRSQDAISRYCDLESELTLLKGERREIIKSLEKLPTLEYDFLFKLYVEDYTFKELASHYKKSYDWVKWKKKNALGKLQAILDEKSTV